MALPSEVTSRAEGNNFIARTGMVLTGITGFGVRTGFYLTNSGSHGIETSVGYNEGNTPGIFEFPSGQNFTILPGKSKFIPFEMNFVQDNINGPMTSDYSTGPDTLGKYETFFTLTSNSQFNGETDGEGEIRVNVTGQVTGFQRVNSTGPWWIATPAHPSGFLVTTDYARDGKPQSVLRWQHPSTGYYLTKYKIEYAGNIEDSSISTGSWTGLHDFEINYEVQQYNGPNISGPINYKKYATNTGIAQKYTRGSNPNPQTPYAEHTVSNLGFNANYYYRIKSQYVDRSDSIYYESPYIYGYPVENFDVTITNTDINGGLLSGSTTLSPTTDPSTVIANDSSDPQAMEIYFTQGQGNINLKNVFDAEINDRGNTVNSFDPTHADYAYTGVHFIVPERLTVGSKTENQAGITTGGQLKYGSTEIKSVLHLKKNSTVAGIGGKGGNGGFKDIELRKWSNNKVFAGGEFGIEVNGFESSTNGANGTAAIYINDPDIAQLRIHKHPTAKIYGGGGGGGGGDPFFWPKAFTYNANDTFEQADYSDRETDHAEIVENDQGVKVLQHTSLKYTSGLTVSTNILNTTLPRSTVLERINFTLADVVGTQLGGVGGGGQGFSTSSGGSSLKDKQDDVFAVFTQTNGNFKVAGYGSSAKRNTKLSPGGNGGVFGQDGHNPLNRDAELLFMGVKDAKSAAGGLAGEGIKIITTNTSYSNLSSLVQYPNALTPTTANFPSLLAWFTSEDESKITKSTVGSYDYISKWTSKNDSSIFINFPWSGTSANNKPMFVENGVTINSSAYTKPFNNQNVVYFGPNNGASGGKLFGLVENGKLEPNMSGFEIIYYIYPGSVAGDDNVRALSWASSAFEIYEPKSNVNGALSGKFDTSIRRVKGNSDGFGVADWTENMPSLFYYRRGQNNMSSEGTGLPNNKRVIFNDFTNGISPERAWMYSVSASRESGGINYKIHNDLNNVYDSGNQFLGLRQFKWRENPLIGINMGIPHDQNKFAGFAGGISDILVFKKRLTDSERAAVYSYIANKRLRVSAVKYSTVTTSATPFIANLTKVRITLVSTPEYIRAGAKIVFSNGAIFTFDANVVKYTTAINAYGTLTLDIPASISGTLYPSNSDRNTLEMQNGFAGFNESSQW
ncbi:hypothetical protein N8462_01000 [bacterium]|nr:hypothetical protein [bacterium]